jgi:hypothetical protein
MTSFSILHGPNEKEYGLVENWINDLGAFLGDEKEYSYGTLQPEEYKIITPDGKIEIQKDQRWEELLGLADVFSGHPEVAD